MDRRVLIDTAVSHSLSVIYEYGVAFDGRRTASRFVSSIKKTIRQVCTHPENGPSEQLLDGDSYGIRSVVAHPYFKVIYIYKSDLNEVYILDVWDTRRDPQDMIARFRYHMNNKH